MTLKEFVKEYDGKQVEYHSYGAGAENQCVDLVNAYIEDVLGFDTIIGTNAKDFPTRANKEQFEYIENTPTGVPNKGDIVVWGSGAGGGYGHVGIFLEGNANSFKSFDQNYSVKYSKIEGHYYTNVIGWLRPISQEVMISPDKKLPEVWRKREEFKEAVSKKYIEESDAYVDQLRKMIDLLDEQDFVIKSLVRDLEAKERSILSYKEELAKHTENIYTPKPNTGTTELEEKPSNNFNYLTMIKELVNKTDGYKTYGLVVMAILVVVLHTVLGWIDADTMQTILVLLGFGTAATLKDAVKKAEK